jgi:hypothetical protein
MSIAFADRILNASSVGLTNEMMGKAQQRSVAAGVRREYRLVFEQLAAHRILAGCPRDWQYMQAKCGPLTKSSHVVAHSSCVHGNCHELIDVRLNGGRADGVVDV